MSAEATVTTTAETPKTPLAKLTARLADIITEGGGYNEMWGVELNSSTNNIPSQVVLQKFLRANNDDVEDAGKQLASALGWRRKMQPARLVEELFDRAKFENLGYVTVHKDDAGKETVITWNIYGAVKDNKATFGNVEEFIKWRAGLMELGVQKLKLNEVKELIPQGGVDPYQMVQVHDYLSVSFLRMDPAVKAASKETIQTFSMAYPELLAHKYFVNVPFIMGWMYGAMKLFLAPATLRKFHPMTSGASLAAELPSIGLTLPSEYGGQGPSVKEAGQQLGFTDGATAAATADKTEPAKEEPAPTTTSDAPVAGETATAAVAEDVVVDGAKDKDMEATPTGAPILVPSATVEATGEKTTV